MDKVRNSGDISKPVCCCVVQSLYVPTSIIRLFQDRVYLQRLTIVRNPSMSRVLATNLGLQSCVMQSSYQYNYVTRLEECQEIFIDLH